MSVRTYRVYYVNIGIELLLLKVNRAQFYTEMLESEEVLNRLWVMSSC